LRVLGVVGEHKELAMALIQSPDEPVRTRDHARASYKNAVHVNEVVFLLPFHASPIIAAVRPRGKARDGDPDRPRGLY
jgi:hypothetical protein